MSKADAVFEKLAVSSSARNWAAKYTPEQIELWAEKPDLDPRPEPKFWNRSMAINRAERWGDSGPKKLIRDPELIKDVFKKSIQGAGLGALGGLTLAELGLLLMGARGSQGANLGRALGAILGGHIGSAGGEIKARADWLKDRGFRATTDWSGASPDMMTGMTPEAKLMYLHPKFKGGGYAADV